MNHKSSHFLTVAKRGTAMHKLFQIYVSLFLAICQTAIELVKIGDRLVEFDLQGLLLALLGGVESVVDGAQG